MCLIYSIWSDKISVNSFKVIEKKKLEILCSEIGLYINTYITKISIKIFNVVLLCVYKGQFF